jgi:hypothetical protein
MAIAVECNADEKLVQLLFSENDVKILHQNGRGNILNYLRKKSTTSGIGLIDEDPGSAHTRDFVSSYEEVECVGNVKRFSRKDNNDITVVMLSPRLEEWIVSRASDSGIKMSDYSLPDDGIKLHDRYHYEKEDNFTSLINKLIELKDKEILTVKKWLSGDNP